MSFLFIGPSAINRPITFVFLECDKKDHGQFWYICPLAWLDFELHLFKVTTAAQFCVGLILEVNMGSKECIQAIYDLLVYLRAGRNKYRWGSQATLTSLN